MDTKMFLIYLELLKKYNMDGTSKVEKKELAKDMELIKNGLLPVKYIIRQRKLLMNERIYIKIKLKYTIISKYVIVKLVEMRKSHYIFIYNGSFYLQKYGKLNITQI